MQVKYNVTSASKKEEGHWPQSRRALTSFKHKPQEVQEQSH